MKTPKHLLVALDRATLAMGGDASIAAPEMLSTAGVRHVERVQSVFNDDNVVGAGIAAKITEGEFLNDLGLIFYVREKRAIENVDPAFLIPPVVAGGQGRAVFTDVIEIGDVVPEQEINFGSPPLRSGFSVCHLRGSAGTLGAFVRKRRKTYVLSNAHVLAESGLAAIGDAILYPGPADGGSDPADVVAKLESFTPFEVDAGFVNTADAALAEVIEPHAAAKISDIFGAAAPTKIATPERGMIVVKRGRTTGETESVVRDTDVRIFVNYPEVGKVGFTGQIRCDRYTEPGDSGAIVVDKATGALVGLHFAGSGPSSIFTPIRTVIKALRFRF